MKAEYLCPQCGLSIDRPDRCPECGVPTVSPQALRLAPEVTGDRESFVVACALRDPLEGEHLVALLESRRIPAIVEGGAQSAAAAGWVAHGEGRFGVLLVPETRLEEARVLILGFRQEIDQPIRHEDEALLDRLAETAEAERPEGLGGGGRLGEAPPGVLRFGRGWLPPILQVAAGSLCLAVAVLAWRLRQTWAAMALLGLGAGTLLQLPTEVVLDARSRTLRLLPPRRRLLGLGPVEVSWDRLAAVDLLPESGGWRLAFRLGDDRAEPLQGTLVRTREEALDAARRAAAFLGLPLLDVVEETTPGADKDEAP